MIARQLTYYQTRLRYFINQGKGAGTDLLDQLLQLTTSSQQVLLQNPSLNTRIDLICAQLSTAFKNSSSQVVDTATYILNYLARRCCDQVTMRMAQKEFQENLAYTLRGVTVEKMQKTSLFGNRLTLHPLLWNEIENRVMKLYQYWYRKHNKEDALYHHILEKYKMLKSQSIAFPEQFQAERPADKPKNVDRKQLQEKRKEPEVQEYDMVSEKEMILVDQLVETTKKALESGQVNKVMNDETIRKLKGKSSQHYTVFTTKKLDEATKQRIKTQYSAMRGLLKQLDQIHSKSKLQEQRKFVAQTIANTAPKQLSQKSIESPNKQRKQQASIDNLLGHDTPAESLPKEVNVLQTFKLKPEPLKNILDEDDNFSDFQSSEQIPEENKQKIQIAIETKVSPQKEPLLLFQEVETVEKIKQKQAQEAKRKVQQEQRANKLIDTEPQKPKQVQVKQPLKNILEQLSL